jgi:hypothetical protein
MRTDGYLSHLWQQVAGLVQDLRHLLASEHHRDQPQGGGEEPPPSDPEAGRRVTTFKVGDRIAAAVLSNKNSALRVGRVEKIHPRTTSTPETRMTIRLDDGRACIVSAARSVLIEADEHHTMTELYEYRMVYNAHAANLWARHGTHFVAKSWRHGDGEECFGGGWFIVVAHVGDGMISNHYKAEHWDLFKIPEMDTAPEWDGHTPAIALERLRNAL